MKSFCMTFLLLGICKVAQSQDKAVESLLEALRLHFDTEEQVDNSAPKEPAKIGSDVEIIDSDETADNFGQKKISDANNDEEPIPLADDLSEEDLFGLEDAQSL